MTFQSLEYLIFLPVVFFLYWTVGRRSRTFQNGLIVAVSLVFYGWWDWRFLGLLLLTAFSTFFAGCWMGKTDDQKKRKAILVGTTVLTLVFYSFSSTTTSLFRLSLMRSRSLIRTLASARSIFYCQWVSVFTLSLL